MEDISSEDPEIEELLTKVLGHKQSIRWMLIGANLRYCCGCITFHWDWSEARQDIPHPQDSKFIGVRCLKYLAHRNESGVSRPTSTYRQCSGLYASIAFCRTPKVLRAAIVFLDSYKPIIKDL